MAAFGNGANDRLLLREVKNAGGLAVAVENGEGCAVETLLEAAVLIHGAQNAIGLLLEPARIKATLRV
jgi:soluble P-type ATPase